MSEPANPRRTLLHDDPRFETGAERYAWLNGMVCVAEGKGIPGGVAYRVYSVVNDGTALADVQRMTFDSRPCASQCPTARLPAALVRTGDKVIGWQNEYTG